MSTASVTNENWGALVLGGVATLTFGVAAVFWPGLTLLTLLYLFSAYVLVSGVVNLIAGLATIDVSDSWFLSLVMGALELGVGVYLLRHTHVAFKTFVLLIGFTLIVRGIMEFVEAFFNAASEARHRTMSYVSGLAGVVVGIVLLFSKAQQGVAFVWLLGLYAMVVGTIQIARLSRGAAKTGRR